MGYSVNINCRDQKAFNKAKAFMQTHFVRWNDLMANVNWGDCPDWGPPMFSDVEPWPESQQSFDWTSFPRYGEKEISYSCGKFIIGFDYSPSDQLTAHYARSVLRMIALRAGATGKQIRCHSNAEYSESTDPAKGTNKDPFINSLVWPEGIPRNHFFINDDGCEAWPIVTEGTIKLQDKHKWYYTDSNGWKPCPRHWEKSPRIAKLLLKSFIQEQIRTWDIADPIIKEEIDRLAKLWDKQ